MPKPAAGRPDSAGDRVQRARRLPAAFDLWVRRRDVDLINYLDEALTAWMSGFAPPDTGGR